MNIHIIINFLFVFDEEKKKGMVNKDDYNMNTHNDISHNNI